MTTFITQQINAKASRAGKTFWEIETNMGKATCFDYPIVQILEQNIGKPISIYDLETNEKGFINLRPAKNKPAQPQGAMQMPSVMPQQAPISDNFREARMSKDVSIYTSYAKDLFIANLNKIDAKVLTKEDLQKLMTHCVDLIKQAKVSFERTEIFQDNNPKVVATFQG